jgi:glutamate racemase
MPDANSPIGVFDSGIGGLSVLRALRSAMPHESFVYFADTAHAPYGEKGDAFVRQRSIAITQQLRAEHGIKALVVACNTATAAAIDDLRALHPDLIIIGIEPALKPAALQSANKRVTVFATQGTLGSAKFQQLLAQQSAQTQFTCIACDGLAETIERHCDDLNHPNIVAWIRQYTADSMLRNGTSTADTVVLGCTHYPLVKHVFTALLAPSISIIDNGAAVAKRLRDQLHNHLLESTLNQATHNPPCASSSAARLYSVLFTSTADKQSLADLWARIT